MRREIREQVRVACCSQRPRAGGPTGVPRCVTHTHRSHGLAAPALVCAVARGSTMAGRSTMERGRDCISRTMSLNWLSSFMMADLCLTKSWQAETGRGEAARCEAGKA
jgi:hypothetical protein